MTRLLAISYFTQVKNVVSIVSRFAVSSHPQRAAMQRFPLPKIRFCRPVLALTVGLGSALFAPNAHADEFSLVPKGDPIYAQLTNLAKPGSEKVASTLTRYEAAVQTARLILTMQESDALDMSRSNWRALRGLTVALKTELEQMGVDVKATIALADNKLENMVQPDLSIPASARRQAQAARNLTPVGGSALFPSTLDNPRIKQNGLEFPLSQRLRASTALTAIERNGKDPFENDFGRRTSNGAGAQNNMKAVGSQASLAYDLSRNLTVRASGSKVSSQAGDVPLLAAPFLNGAGEVSEAGGGLDVNIGSNLKLSTELARLRGDNGTQASRIGGGASISAFQNRLSMRMSLSRLQPEDDAALPSNSAHVGVGIDVTRRLSLSLLYQGLFTESTPNTSRVSGGFSLNF
ncbi:hypothetical protein EON80_02835 [bacterium]|nr:MAG: hypothetical protein EON80_02835 [bacterium]